MGGQAAERTPGGHAHRAAHQGGESAKAVRCSAVLMQGSSRSGNRSAAVIARPPLNLVPPSLSPPILLAYTRRHALPADGAPPTTSCLCPLTRSPTPCPNPHLIPHLIHV